MGRTTDQAFIFQLQHIKDLDGTCPLLNKLYHMVIQNSFSGYSVNVEVVIWHFFYLAQISWISAVFKEGIS